MSSPTELDSDLRLYSIRVACKFGTVKQKTHQRSHTNTQCAQGLMQPSLLQYCQIFKATAFLTTSLTHFTPKCDFCQFQGVAQLQLHQMTQEKLCHRFQCSCVARAPFAWAILTPHTLRTTFSCCLKGCIYFFKWKRHLSQDHVMWLW